MEPRKLSRSDPATLAGLLDVAAEQGELWQPDELGAILQHQLEAALEFDLGRFEPGLCPTVARLLQTTDKPPIRTFRELFCHPRPPKELLNLTRQFAKSWRQSGENSLPAEIATVLYVASITAALTRLGERLTTLDNTGLRHSLRWALAQPWLDEEIGRLLAEGLQLVGPADDD